MEILKSLDSASFVDSYDVIDYKTFGPGFYIKIKVILKDKSELHIYKLTHTIGTKMIL